MKVAGEIGAIIHCYGHGNLRRCWCLYSTTFILDIFLWKQIYTKINLKKIKSRVFFILLFRTDAQSDQGISCPHIHQRLIFTWRCSYHNHHHRHHHRHHHHLEEVLFCIFQDIMMQMKKYSYMFESQPELEGAHARPADTHYVTSTTHMNPPGRCWVYLLIPASNSFMQ